MKNTSKFLLLAVCPVLSLAVLVLQVSSRTPPSVTKVKIERRFNMPLNTGGYYLSGAGLAAANGSYVPVTGANATLNGATQYTNGTDFLAFVTTPGAPYWGVNGVVNAAYNSGQVLYNVSGGSTTSIPLTGWSVASAPGVAPVPVLTPIVVASGASTAAVNGNYIPVSGASSTLNGAIQYTNGTYFLGYTGTTWLIDTTINNGAIPTCSSPTAGASTTSIPASGWSGSASCNTPPTFLVISSVSGPVAGVVPTVNATTTGVSTLSINTQALTSGATSELVNVYTNAAGTTPIAGSPFAVPTPGTAVVVTLVSGTQYYISVGMVGSSTVNGPLLALLFDTLGPVITSAVIQPSGNTLIVTHTEYSQPLQANGSLHALTGLTGGPDTLTTPVYGGTTITYTLSRTVISSETGGLLNAPAGAFKDSAFPTNNASPVVTNLAVTNNSTTAAPPTAPTGVLVNPGNNLNTINWTNGTGSTSANVYRCATLGGTYVKLTAGTNIVAVTFADATAVNGTTYYYEVSNSNSGGEGPLSTPGVSGTPYLPGGSSSPITGLTAVYVAGSGIQLSWTNPAGNAYTGVNVYRLSGASVNGVFQRIDPAVNQPLPVTASFLDKPGLGYVSLTGSAGHAYAVCGVVNNVETVLSNITSLVTFLG